MQKVFIYLFHFVSILLMIVLINSFIQLSNAISSFIQCNQFIHPCNQFIHPMQSVHSSNAISSFIQCNQFIHPMQSVHSSNAISSFNQCNQFIHPMQSAHSLMIDSFFIGNSVGSEVFESGEPGKSGGGGWSKTCGTEEV